MRKELYFSAFLSILILACLSSASMYQNNYTISYNTGSSSSTHLQLQTLRYDPFPVTPGSTFDLWVQVQNTGQASAHNVVFEIIQSYPFSTNDTIRNFDYIAGTGDAYAVNQLGNVNDLVLHYRISVANDAPKGISGLKLAITSNVNEPDATTIIDELPISVQNTKTDFDVVMQDASPQGTSFSLANIGENPANAITVSIEPQPGISLSGAQSSIVGNLNAGDFTTVTYQISSRMNASRTNFAGRNSGNLPNQYNNTDMNVNSVKIKIAYTDMSGVRNTIEKTVPVDLRSAVSSVTSARTTGSTSPYLYIILGIVVGVLAALIIKRKSKHKE